MRIRSIITALGMLVVALQVGTASADHKPQPPTVPTDFTVKAGGHKPGDKMASWSYTRFYPEKLQIHRGMTVKWEFENSFAGLHTVLFAADDHGADALDGAEPPMSIRSDELPGSLALNEQGWVFGSEQGIHGEKPCGRLGGVNFDRGTGSQAPCVLRPGTTVSSGLSDQFFSGYRGPNDKRGYSAFAPFGVTFGSATGDDALAFGSFKYFCKYHPGMEGEIEVVEDSVPLKSQQEINAEVKAEMDADAKIAEAYVAEHRTPEPPTIDEDGNREWKVEVGGATEGGEVNFIEFFPSQLPDVRPGDSVRFVVKGDEWQTVTFPTETVGGLNSFGECHTAECTGDAIPWGEFVATFPWGCDVDGPTQGLPHLPLHVPTRGCQAGALEWVFGPNTASGQPAPGDVVATPATRHNSGLMLAEDMPAWSRHHPHGEWASEFRARFVAPGTFNFTCLIHPQAMKGSIVVGV